MLQNPELQEFSWQVRAAEARVLQAGLRPNPELSLELEDVLGSGDFHSADQAQVTLQLGRIIELGGKRAARREVAKRGREMSSRAFETKRVEVLAEVTRRFIGVLARQDEVSLAQTSLELGENTLASAARRVSAGTDSALTREKAATTVARLRIAREHAEHELRVARHDLAATWAGSTPTFKRASGDLYARRALPSFEGIVGRLDTAPEIVTDTSEAQLRAAEARLADAKRTPNLVIDGGARWLEGPGDHSFVFGLSMPLPLSDRNQGGSAAALAELRASEHGAAATKARLHALLFALVQELAHAATALDMLERDILPSAERSLELSRAGFAKGRLSYLDVADAHRTLVEVKRERIETAAAYQEYVLEIERVLGGPIDEEQNDTQSHPKTHQEQGHE
jgi:cobalt-zinc-cadmium efflux system outer membrane protein